MTTNIFTKLNTARLRIVLPIAVLLIVFTPLVIAFVVKSVHAEIIDFAKDKIKNDINLFETLLDHRYPGAWQIRNGNLYKGNVKLNGNYEPVDYFSSHSGNTATIFQGDTRISTSVKNEKGERAVGTKVDPKVAEAVLKQGRDYFGTADILGKEYVTAYRPIKDENGKIIGMIYTGIPLSSLDIIKKRITLEIGLPNFLLLLFIMATILLTTRWVKLLDKTAEFASRIAEGDMTVSVVAGGTTELQKMQKALNNMVSSLRQTVAVIMDNANKLVNIVEQLSQSTNQSAAAATETASTASEIAANVERVATNSERVFGEVKNVSDDAQRSSKLLSDAKIQTNQLQKSFDDIATAVQRLYERMNNIAQVSQTITDIAEQTNLLALNAAIEAARAGEAGRGFAVVAEEVRKLAKNSAGAAKKIMDTVFELENEMTEVVNTADHNAAVVGESVKVINNAVDSLTAIISRVENLADKVQEIQEAISQVNTAVQGIAAAAEEQSAINEEISASAEMLNNMAAELNEQVQKFKV